MLLRKSLRLVWSAVLHDYLNQPGLFLARRLEAPLIALALFFVQANLFGDMGAERFLLSWLGVIILTWTLKSILKVDEAQMIYSKISGAVPYPVFLSAQCRAARLLVDVLADLAVVVIVLLTVRGSSDVLGMALSATFVVMTQAAFNFCFFPLHLQASRWLNVKNAMVVVFVFFAIMSPVFFTFDDLNRFGSQYFTSINPASHFLAAYYNVFWFQVPVSMQVLPSVFVLSVLFVWAFAFIIKVKAPLRGTTPPLYVPGKNALTLNRFVERGSITGLDLFYNFYAMGSLPMRGLPEKVDRLLSDPEFDNQLCRGISTYSRVNDLHLDLLLASCLSGADETRVLLADEEMFNITQDQLEVAVKQVNAIMDTKMSVTVGSVPMDGGVS